ncbi:MAG: hypothetical protein HN348_02835, partial [Proteobacteria bacterium]|nr:hypothetical protein [Pseudomonadota bacterium]
MGNDAIQDLLRQEVKVAAMGWGKDLTTLEKKELATLNGLADNARTALATSEPQGLDDAQSGANTVFDKYTAKVEALDTDLQKLAAKDADVSVLNALRDEVLASMLPAYANEVAFGKAWVISEYRGNAGTTIMQSYRGGVDCPPASGNPTTDAARWKKFMVIQVDRFRSALVEGQETREFAEGLPDFEDASWRDATRAYYDSPATNEVGREREYCEAVLFDIAPSWEKELGMGGTHLAHQIAAEDAEGWVDWDDLDAEKIADIEWEGNIDFDDLDDGVSTIEDEVDDTWVNDDTIMAALEDAEAVELERIAL